MESTADFRLDPAVAVAAAKRALLKERTREERDPTPCT
jgi:hypothetical protein